MRSLVVTVSLVVSECLKTVSEMHAACPFTFVTFKMYYLLHGVLLVSPSFCSVAVSSF